MQRVRIVPSRSRPVITPRITIRLRSGVSYTATATGREFMFDLREEIDRISVLAPDLPIPKAQFDEIVSAVADLTERAGSSEPPDRPDHRGRGGCRGQRGRAPEGDVTTMNTRSSEPVARTECSVPAGT